MSSTHRILIVEDEAIAALALRAELEAAGIEVCGSVDTGEAAVECALEQHPDVILMDMGLAGKLSGVDAAVQISENYLPRIIFITGYADLDVQLGRIPGILNTTAVEVLQKPLKYRQMSKHLSTSQPV